MPNSTPTLSDLYVVKVINDFDERSIGFSSINATRIRKLSNGKYVRVAQGTAEENAKSNGNFEFSQNSPTFHFAFFGKDGLMAIADRSSRLVISGGEINIGHLTYSNLPQEERKIFTMVIEGDYNTSNPPNPGGMTRNTIRNNPTRVSPIASLDSFPTPKFVVGYPCPPLWIPTTNSSTTNSNFVTKWSTYVNAILKEIEG